MSKNSKHLLLISQCKPEDVGLLAAFGYAGYQATRWSEDQYANTALGIEHSDVVVVDLDRSDVLCFAELERRRRSARAIPVLVLLGGADAKERIDALDAGADDCLSRPFDPEELRARLDALSRRNRDPKIRIGTFVWHWTHREASIGSTPLLLSPSETLLLEELLRSPDRIVSTLTLTRRIERSNSSSSLNRLYVYICRLRKKLAGAGLEIRSSSGLGYALDTRGAGLDADVEADLVVEAG